MLCSSTLAFSCLPARSEHSAPGVATFSFSMWIAILRPLCCLRVVCAKNACVDRAPFLSRRLPFHFFFLLFCRALSDTGYRFSLVSASACVRARLRRRYVAGLIKSVQYSRVQSTPPTVAHAARSKSSQGIFSSNPSSSLAHSLPRLCHRIHFCL